jgi:hypothetical protein
MSRLSRQEKESVALVAIGIFVIALTLIALIWAPVHAQDREWSLGTAVGADISGEFSAVTFSGYWLPTKPNLDWGVVSYLQVGPYGYREGSGTSAALGIEPVVTAAWGRWRVGGGMGLAVNNTTPNLGTPINFSSVVFVGYQINPRWKVQVNGRHLSHGARLGIARDKPNGGTTVISAEAVLRF